jgi:hypothetical protein
MSSLTPSEVVILGTAIAFEIVKNQTTEQLKDTCSLLSQVLYTLSNLIKN